ncbi:secretion protein HlyD family protein [Sulfuricurvum kujiense DSM 16994]|uniref:Secretion protein HlyD family protein n=1 Tax=Sulfuricurvum kujiense (strain ATCC BAA-921 / DSM 16994 / JCM 11577 / YK-1) TaxID=709032 RepID=E4U0S1_SULKY|nr:HlyD family secretion protein [Sulfuricurvum kujiense]ADR33297.1 secretion protein HlyD family protein [Sulfuricurvum kujiense DSM 16994]
MNKNKFSKLLRFVITFSVVSLAVFLGILLWDNYMNSAWTRDGRVRADVVMVAPDVGGLVSRVAVIDNQFVRKGDLLYQIDDVRFHHALTAAEAIAQTRKAEYEMKKHQSARRSAADNETVSAENRDDALYDAEVARAKYEEAIALVETEKLNVERSAVRAPCDGWVSNLLLRKGDYVQAGEKRMAMITQGSFWVYGYFEEHKLSLIHVGDKAEMKMLGTKFVVKGHVESIARGISDRDNTTDGRLLANVNPIFTWVRLAQRIPVRIHIDKIPNGMELSAGMTCSVSIFPNKSGH